MRYIGIINGYGTMTTSIKKKKNKGMTMVETLAAFTILIILSLSFLACIHFASRMSLEADDKRKASMQLDEKLARYSSSGFTLVVKKDGVVLKNLSDTESATYSKITSDSKVYMLKYPADDPKVCVMRFEK